MSAVARRLRAVPRAAELVSEDAPHAACILEQARRAEYLRRVIAEHADEVAEWRRNYEELADLYNTARTELNQWRAWGAQRPRGRDRAED